MQLRLLASLLLVSFFSFSCAGIPLPFTDYHLGHFMVEVEHTEVNSSCTDLTTLNAVAFELNQRHLEFIRSQNFEQAITVEELLTSLGEECQSRFVRLSVPQIKNELFGDIQTISDSSKLRELGGLAFEYTDVATKGAIELSLHVQESSQGPERRLVGVYGLADGKVLHFNYSGLDNVDEKSRSWPLDAFFGAVFSAASKAAVP